MITEAPYGALPAILRQMQGYIEALYAVKLSADVAAFIVDAALHRRIPGATPELAEQLLVAEGQDGNVDLALFIAPSILRQLRAPSMQLQLSPHNLDSFCVALEGVSHFVFVAWRAGLQRPVTALELELQAEVDKFMCCAWWSYAGLTSPELTPTAVWRRLFAACALHEAVAPQERGRYITAHRAARHFCANFLRKHGPKPAADVVLATSRDFCRRGLVDKLALGA